MFLVQEVVIMPDAATVEHDINSCYRSQCGVHRKSYRIANQYIFETNTYTPTLPTLTEDALYLDLRKVFNNKSNILLHIITSRHDFFNINISISKVCILLGASQQTRYLERWINIKPVSAK